MAYYGVLVQFCMTRTLDDKDIIEFLREKGPIRRMHILPHLTCDEVKPGVHGLGASSLDKRLQRLLYEKKIKRRKLMYYAPRPRKTKKQKKMAKNAELPKNQNIDTIQDKGAEARTKFLKRIEKDEDLAESLQVTAFLLESTILLLDKICPNGYSHEAAISDSRKKCQVHLALVKKIMDEKFAHLDGQRENEYVIMAEKAQESYNEKYCDDAPIKKYNAVLFRAAFSDVILRIRRECWRIRYEPPATNEEREINHSCNLAAVTLNEACRNGYDLVVDSYEYDYDEQNEFSITTHNLTGTAPPEISQLYFDGKKHTFSVIDIKKLPTLPLRPNFKVRSDSKSPISSINMTRDPKSLVPDLTFYPSYSTVKFYPGVKIGENSMHVISIMIQCMEFSFEVVGRQRLPDTMPLLSPIKNKVAEIGPVYPQYESDTVLLVPQTGGEILDVIESHAGREFNCMCGKAHPCKGWIGFPHDNGTPDGSSKKYWMMIKCDNTGRLVPLRYIRKNICD